MFATRLRPLLAISLVVAACSGAQTTDTGSSEKPPLLLTADGLAGLDPNQKIDGTVINRAFPDLVVDSDGFGVRYAIRRNGATLALVEPTGEQGYRAKVIDSSVLGPEGVRVGDPWAKIEPMKDIQCRRGAGEWASQIYCTTPRLAGIVFGFNGATVDTGSCSQDCAVSQVTVLEGHPIRMIDWERPPGVD